MDPVGSQHTGGFLRKYIRIDPAVVRDGDQLIAALGFYPVCQALGGLTYHIDIHPVGADAKNTPKTGSTKLQRNGKAFLDLLLVSGDFCQLLDKGRIFQPGLGPALIFIQIHFCHLSLFEVFICKFDNYTIKHFAQFVNIIKNPSGHAAGGGGFHWVIPRPARKLRPLQWGLRLHRSLRIHRLRRTPSICRLCHSPG